MQALHAFCLADVSLCMPPNDPASFARCLAPYLKVPPPEPAVSPAEKKRAEAEQRRGAERLLCILSIISALLGRLDRLAADAAQDLESDLVQLINVHNFVQVSLQCNTALSTTWVNPTPCMSLSHCLACTAKQMSVMLLQDQIYSHGHELSA